MPISRFAPIACLLGLVLLSNPAVNMSAFAGERSEPKESALLLSDHLLSGRLWSTAGNEVKDFKKFEEELKNADYLLLGEKHDNEKHHAFQSIMVSLAGGSGKTGQLIAEMIEPQHQDVLDRINKVYSIDESKVDDVFALNEEKEGLLASLGDDLNWEKRGWPHWESYKTIFITGLEWGWPLTAGNPNRETIMSIGRGGKLGPDLLTNLRWDQNYSQEQTDSLLDELVESHCGMMGRESMQPLVTLQRLKDAHMARAMRQGLPKNGVSVLIAGNGHVRKDRGVPFFLDGDKKTVSVAIIEVVRDQLEASSYPAFDPKLYDYVWFTPRVDEIDPCDKFREQLERMKQKMKTKSGAKDHGKS